MNNKWDKRFLALANHKAQWSKDPKTGVGCVIAIGNQDKFFGYNGFPPGIYDIPARLSDYNTKQRLVIHAEMNAILSAKESLEGHTLYVTRPTCIRCAVIIIKMKIIRVVCYQYPTLDKALQHEEEQKLVRELYSEAGIIYETDHSKALKEKPENYDEHEVFTGRP